MTEPCWLGSFARSLKLMHGIQFIRVGTKAENGGEMT